MTSDDEPRYTPDEMFDRDFEFLKQEQQSLAKRGIRTWEHGEPLLRFIAYLKNTDFRIIKGLSERCKGQMLGERTKGDLFTEKQ
jgi:hypothetical protein